MRPHAARRGIVLLVVSGILSLLAVVASVFVATSGGTRSVGRASLDDTRALLLSSSGIEYARSRLARSIAVPATATATNRADDWRFRDDPRLPLDAVHNPSYAQREMFLDGGGMDGRYTPPPGSPDGFDPALHDVDGDGRHSAWTGRLRGTYARCGDTFTLRILDPAARLDLNLPDDGAGVDGGGGLIPGRFGRVLNRLGVAIAAADGIADPISGRGADVALRRGTLPGGRFAEIDALLGPPPGGLTLAQVRAVRPYLTVGAPSDPDVVAPRFNASGAIVGVDPLPRPSVSLASADAVVLEAVLGLAGNAEKVVDFSMGDILPNPARRYVNPMTRVAASLPAPAARALAVAAVARRAADPFDTWAEWRAWLRTLPAGITIAQADLVDAATNPNTLLNKYNPDPIALRRFDKLDVTQPTTELTLAGSGRFETTSLGLVRFARGPACAATQMRASLDVVRTARHTTQAHFEAAGSLRSRVVTLPEPTAAGAVPTAWDGQVILARARDTSGADPLHVPLEAGLDALDESPLPAGFPPTAEAFGPSVFDTARSGAGFFAGGQIGPGSGLYVWHRRAEILKGGAPYSTWQGYTYAGPPNAPWQGPASMEAWFKPVWRAGTDSPGDENVMSACLWFPGPLATDHSSYLLNLGVLASFGGRYLMSVSGPNGQMSLLGMLPAEWGTARRWHHIVISWQPSGAFTEFNLFFDGVRTPDSPLLVPTVDFLQNGQPPSAADPANHAWRFGSAPYVLGNAPPIHFRHVYGSYGRIVVSDAPYRPGYAQPGFTPNEIYETSDPSLAAGPPGRPALARIESSPIPLPLGSRLLDLSWTAYVPSGSRVLATADPGTGAWMHRWSWNGAAWVWPAAADTSGAPLPLEVRLSNETDPVAFPGMSLVRYRAILVGSSSGAPATESPVLDDVTLRYVPPGGPVLTGYTRE